MSQKQESKHWYMQWCTRDWLGDPAVSACRPATRGVLMDLLCAMHEAGRSGELRGTSEMLSRVARCSTADFEAAMTDIKTTGAADVECRNGVYLIRNRRMAREEKARKCNAERQKGFRERRASRESNAAVAPHSNSNSNTPISPRGAGVVDGEAGEEDADPPGFERFWAAYPDGKRGKAGRPACLALWAKASLEVHADRIVAHVEAARRSTHWQRDGGQFIPSPKTYLADARYNDAPPASAATARPTRTNGVAQADAVAEKRKQDQLADEKRNAIKTVTALDPDERERLKAIVVSNMPMSEQAFFAGLDPLRPALALEIAKLATSPN